MTENKPGRSSEERLRHLTSRAEWIDLISRVAQTLNWDQRWKKQMRDRNILEEDHQAEKNPDS